MIRFASIFARDTRGTMAIETALIMSTLALLGLGAVQATSLVSKKAEMQAAVSQAEQIIAVVKPSTTTELNTLKTILKSSAALTTDPVVAFRYRCGTDSSLGTTAGACGSSTEWTYIRMVLTYTYTPTWVEYGFGSPINLTVTRMAQVS